MKAIRIHAHGDASQMQFEEVPVPACGPNDVLVRVVAAGIGSDAAGVVTAVGDAVTAFSPGDDVFFHAEFARGGTYAEYVA